MASWTPARLHAFKPVGRCIYCGNKDRRLGKEHVIPLGLGGRIILPNSSCIVEDSKDNPSCSDITREIERLCQRDMLGNLRMRLDMPTRNPKQRPDKINIGVGDGDGVAWTHKSTIEIPVLDFPRALFLPVFHPPRIITKDTDPDWLGDTWEYIDRDDLEAFHSKYNIWPELAHMHPLYFCRMIAKIAHAWTVGVEGIDGFEPLLLDFILGKTNVIRDYIGCLPELPPKTEAIRKHALTTDYYRIDDIEYVGSNVRLFSDLGAPEYVVIVGKRLPK
jgi:hypothetical protein